MQLKFLSVLHILRLVTFIFFQFYHEVTKPKFAGNLCYCHFLGVVGTPTNDCTVYTGKECTECTEDTAYDIPTV